MIRQALLHADRRLRSIRDEGWGFFYFLLGGFMFAIGVLNSGYLFRGSLNETTPFLSLIFFLYSPMLLSIGIRGRRSGLAGKGFFSKADQGHNMPTLPVGDRARVLGEALLATACVVWFSIPLFLLTVLFSKDIIGSLAGVGGITAFAFPVFVLFALPVTSRWALVVRFAAVLAGVFGMVHFELYRSPLLMLLLGVVAGVAILVGMDLVRPRSFVRLREKRSAVIFRKNERSPFSLYLRDIFAYSIKRVLPRGLAVALLTVAAVELLERFGDADGYWGMICPMFFFFWAFMEGQFPLGSGMLARDNDPHASTVSHAYMRSFSRLPLSEDQVLAGVFLHGAIVQVISLLAVLAIVLFSLLGPATGFFRADVAVSIMGAAAVTAPLLLVLVPISALASALGWRQKAQSFNAVSVFGLMFLPVLGAWLVDRIELFLLFLIVTLAGAVALFFVTRCSRCVKTLLFELRRGRAVQR